MTRLPAVTHTHTSQYDNVALPAHIYFFDLNLIDVHTTPPVNLVKRRLVIQKKKIVIKALSSSLLLCSASDYEHLHWARLYMTRKRFIDDYHLDKELAKLIKRQLAVLGSDADLLQMFYYY